MTAIESVQVKGFRSLVDFRVEDLPSVAVMIGPNGAGKSNLFRFFEMTRWMLTAPGGLARFVRWQGGADDQFFGGHARTERIKVSITVRVVGDADGARADYRFVLAHANPDGLVFDDERFRFRGGGQPSDLSHDLPCGPANDSPWHELGSGHTEAKLPQAVSDWTAREATAAREVVDTLRGCSAHQFHDTSDRSRIKRSTEADDRACLRGDGSNLAAVLHLMEQDHIKHYERICRHIRRVLPVFDRFAMDARNGRVTLRWKAKSSNKTYGAHLTSDASLRLFALVTLLNLPLDLLPSVILLDEPELGLHPAAVSLIGGMIQSLASQRQIIVATQSSLLVDAFNLDQLFVLDLDADATTARRMKSADYREWLNEYSTGQLWEKNLLGGYP